MTETKTLDGGAGVGTLLKAALPALPGVGLLPGVRKNPKADPTKLSYRREVAVDRGHVERYAAVCGFPVKDTVPLPYPHMLAFPLHMAIMTDPGFPFPAIGTVHLENSITGLRAIGVDERLTVTTRVDNPRDHAKGRTLDFVTEVVSGDEPVWRSTSTYLRIGKGSADASSGTAFQDVPPSGTVWRLPGDLGRQYAAVSGDHNPIHLYPLTAKALGFKRQIAHGMWTKARCIAQLENRLPDAVTVEVAFKKPVFLPSTVAFGSRPAGEGFEFSLTNPKSGAPHLLGRTHTP